MLVLMLIARFNFLFVFYLDPGKLRANCEYFLRVDSKNITLSSWQLFFRSKNHNQYNLLLQSEPIINVVIACTYNRNLCI